MLHLRYPYPNLLTALLLQLLVLVVAPPAVVQQPLNVAFTLWVAVAARTISGQMATFLIASLLGITPALLELLIPFEASPLPLRLLKEGFWILFPCYVARVVLMPLFRSVEVSFHEVSGAIALYILIGMGFGDLFELVHDLNPGAIKFHNLPVGATPQFDDFLYLSFVTLTTTGYGDVAPVHPIARAVAMFEALVGLMYLSVLVARVVAINTHRATLVHSRNPIDTVELQVTSQEVPHDAPRVHEPAGADQSADKEKMSP